MKEYFIKLLLLSACLQTMGCNSTAAPAENTAPQTQQSARAHDKLNGTQYAERAQNLDEITLTGQKTTHSRILAAGGFIAGAIGGS